jgi:hypothetical protein
MGVEVCIEKFKVKCLSQLLWAGIESEAICWNI